MDNLNAYNNIIKDMDKFIHEVADMDRYLTMSNHRCGILKYYMYRKCHMLHLIMIRLRDIHTEAQQCVLNGIKSNILLSIESMGKYIASNKIYDIFIQPDNAYQCFIKYSNQFRIIVEETINAIEAAKPKDINVNVCPICIEPLMNKEIKTQCNHSFHIQCLAMWSSKHSDCPMCRRPM